MSMTPTDLWSGRAIRFGFGAAAIGVATLAGIARNKWFALHLEPEGIGVMGQVIATHTWIGALAGLGLGIPLAQRIGKAVAEGNVAGVRRAVWTALTLVATGVVLALGLGLVVAEAISTAVLGRPDYATAVRISMMGAAGYALHALLQGIYAGHANVRPPLTMAIAGGIVSVVTALLVVPRAGIAGGILSAAIYFPAGLLAVVLVHRSMYWRSLLPRPEQLFNRPLAREMIVVGMAALLLALADQGVLLMLRSHFVRVQGLEANGLFQASLAISQQMGGPFYVFLANHAFGLVSGMSDVATIRAFTRKIWLPIVLTATIAFAAVMLAGAPLLRLLYSDRFDPAQPMMAWMLFGEFCRVLSLTWGVSALPYGGKRLWITVGLSYPLPLLLTYLAYAGSSGALSLPHAAATTGIISLSVVAVVMSRIGITLSRKDLFVAAVCLALMAALAARVAA